jgi:hypothetical protein
MGVNTSVFSTKTSASADQKTNNLHDAMPKQGAFSKDFPTRPSNIAADRAGPHIARHSAARA